MPIVPLETQPEPDFPGEPENEARTTAILRAGHIKREYKFVDIAAGMGHILLLDSEGKVYGQGARVKGQLGRAERPTTDPRFYRSYLKYSQSLMELGKIPFNEPVAQVNAGKYHSMLLTSTISVLMPRLGSGDAYIMGSQKLRPIDVQIHSKEIEDAWDPKRVLLPVDAKIKQIATGDCHTLFLTGRGVANSWW